MMKRNTISATFLLIIATMGSGKKELDYEDLKTIETIARDQNVNISSLADLAIHFDAVDAPMNVSALSRLIGRHGFETVLEVVRRLASQDVPQMVLEIFDTLSLEENGKLDALQRLENMVDFRRSADFLEHALEYLSLRFVVVGAGAGQSKCFRILEALARGGRGGFPSLLRDMEPYLLTVPLDRPDWLRARDFFRNMPLAVHDRRMFGVGEESCGLFRRFQRLVTRHTYLLYHYSRDHHTPPPDASEDYEAWYLSLLEHWVRSGILNAEYDEAVRAVRPYLVASWIRTPVSLFDVY